MLYEWIGRKPHRRHQNVMAMAGRGKTRVTSVDVIEIKPGQIFEPTPDELTFFSDMMRPVAAGLRVEDAPSEVHAEELHEEE